MGKTAPHSDNVPTHISLVNKASMIILGLAIAATAWMIHLVAIRLPSLRDHKLFTVLEDSDYEIPAETLRVLEFPTVAVVSVAALVAIILALKERLMKNRTLCLAVNTGASVVVLIISICLTEMYVNGCMEMFNIFESMGSD